MELKFISRMDLKKTIYQMRPLLIKIQFQISSILKLLRATIRTWTMCRSSYQIPSRDRLILNPDYQHKIRIRNRADQLLPTSGRFPATRNRFWIRVSKPQSIGNGSRSKDSFRETRNPPTTTRTSKPSNRPTNFRSSITTLQTSSTFLRRNILLCTTRNLPSRSNITTKNLLTSSTSGTTRSLTSGVQRAIHTNMVQLAIIMNMVQQSIAMSMVQRLVATIQFKRSATIQTKMVQRKTL